MVSGGRARFLSGDVDAGLRDTVFTPVYPKFRIIVVTDRGHDRVEITGAGDMARAVQMQAVDHLGVETAAGHDEEDATVGPAGVALHHGPFDHGPAALLGSGAQAEVPGQQIFVAGGKDGQRQPGHRAIDQFGHSAVAAHGDQGPQTALGEQSIGFGRNFIEIGEDRDFETLLRGEVGPGAQRDSRQTMPLPSG